MRSEYEAALLSAVFKRSGRVPVPDDLTLPIPVTRSLYCRLSYDAQNGQFDTPGSPIVVLVNSAKVLDVSYKPGEGGQRDNGADLGGTLKPGKNEIRCMCLTLGLIFNWTGRIEVISDGRKIIDRSYSAGAESYRPHDERWLVELSRDGDASQPALSSGGSESGTQSKGTPQ